MDKKLPPTDIDMYLLNRLDDMERRLGDRISELEAHAKHEGGKSGRVQGGFWAVLISIIAAVADRFFGH